MHEDQAELKEDNTDNSSDNSSDDERIDAAGHRAARRLASADALPSAGQTRFVFTYRCPDDYETYVWTVDSEGNITSPSRLPPQPRNEALRRREVAAYQDLLAATRRQWARNQNARSQPQALGAHAGLHMSWVHDHVYGHREQPLSTEEEARRLFSSVSATIVREALGTHARDVLNTLYTMTDQLAPTLIQDGVTLTTERRRDLWRQDSWNQQWHTIPDDERWGTGDPPMYLMGSLDALRAIIASDRHGAHATTTSDEGSADTSADTPKPTSALWADAIQRADAADAMDTLDNIPPALRPLYTIALQLMRADAESLATPGAATTGDSIELDAGMDAVKDAAKDGILMRHNSAHADTATDQGQADAAYSQQSESSPVVTHPSLETLWSVLIRLERIEVVGDVTSLAGTRRVIWRDPLVAVRSWRQSTVDEEPSEQVDLDGGPYVPYLVSSDVTSLSYSVEGTGDRPNRPHTSTELVEHAPQHVDPAERSAASGDMTYHHNMPGAAPSADMVETTPDNPDNVEGYDDSDEPDEPDKPDEGFSWRSGEPMPEWVCLELVAKERMWRVFCAPNAQR